MTRFANPGVPLYYQLATLLREKIVSRFYRPGDQLPSEAVLVKEYGLSRMTVRQARGSLEGEGLLRREAGRGTFVTESPPGFKGDLTLDHSIGDLITMGQATSVKLLELKEVEASPQEVADLSIADGSSESREKG